MGIECEIPGAAGGRIDHDEVRQIALGQREMGEIHIRVNIAIDHEKRRVAEQWQGVQQAAAGFQRSAALE